MHLTAAQFSRLCVRLKDENINTSYRHKGDVSVTVSREFEELHSGMSFLKAAASLDGDPSFYIEAVCMRVKNQPLLNGDTVETDTFFYVQHECWNEDDVEKWTAKMIARVAGVA